MTAKLNRPLRLALVGMSGAGKTYWTRHLAACGYPTVSCDDLIETRLKGALEREAFSGINGVAAWMGWPDQPTYAERESQYLSEETATLDTILSQIEKERDRELVLDTTGSVVYTGNHLLYRLRRLMTVVYLVASAQEQQLLVERYLSDPKPVLWRGAFHPRQGETPKDTVARCYPALLGARQQSYQTLAHCSVGVAALRELGKSAELQSRNPGELFLEQVREQLARTS
jgi:shikimate kinase